MNESQIRATIRQQVSAVLALPEAQGRERLAIDLALSDPTPSLADISKALKSTPITAAHSIGGVGGPPAALKAFVEAGQPEMSDAALIAQSVALLPKERRRGGNHAPG